jgi:hypothetical protein
MLTRTQDDEQLIERVAALDIGKAELMCCAVSPTKIIRGSGCRKCRPAPR